MKNQSERYKADLARLVSDGKKIAVALQYDYDIDSARKSGMKKEELPDPRQVYQAWYSEALACVTQLLPNRTEDFVSYYKPLKPRKALGSANYTMSDYLIGATVYSSSTSQWVMPTGAALTAVYNQFKLWKPYSTDLNRRCLTSSRWCTLIYWTMN